jgi:hypothetical protein
MTEDPYLAGIASWHPLLSFIHLQLFDAFIKPSKSLIRANYACSIDMQIGRLKTRHNDKHFHIGFSIRATPIAVPISQILLKYEYCASNVDPVEYSDTQKYR